MNKSSKKNRKNKKKGIFEFGYRSHISGVLRGFIVGILVLAQLAFIIVASISFTTYTVYFYLLLEIASLIVIMSLMSQDKCASYKISWVCIILLLPLSGHVMYILWGTANTNKKIEDKILAKINHGYTYVKDDNEIRNQFKKEYPREKRMSDYMSAEHFPLFKNNKISYYPMGEDVFTAMFEDIKKAEKFIFIDFFIVAEGLLWTKMHDLLKKKISEGVKVRFLYDDFGAMFRTDKYFKDMLEKEGFEVRVFNPIHRYIEKLYLNYRSHQKIVVIDGNIGYTGGMNIADEYANIIERFGVWKDTGVRIEGDAVWGLTVTFLQMWDVSSDDGNPVSYEKYKPTAKFPQNKNYCHVISDGPANDPENPIVNTYMQMISYADKFLYITTPYLVLEESMKDELIRTAKSGVDIRIITPKIPDKKTIKLLTNYNYGSLLKAGIRIYEYTPGFIHAKMIVSDNSAIVGTINMDYRSFYLHYECGVWMCAPEIVNTIKKDIQTTLDQSEEITYEMWKKRPFYVKAYQLIFNLFQTLA